MRLKIAFRNVFRNQRRTLLNVGMIAGGVAAIVVFEGFTLNLLRGLRETMIRTQTGHIQIATPIFWRKTAKTSKESLLPNSTNLIKEVSRHPEVSYATGKIRFFSLISNGELSFSARGLTFDPWSEGPISRSYKIVRGKPYQTPTAYQVVLGVGLANRLRIRPGGRVTVLTNTYEGVVNALDLEVVGIFQTVISEFDDNNFLIPLKTAQSLLDTDKVEQIVIGLKSTETTSALTETLQKDLGAKVGVKPWYILAKLYNQVAGFNRIQMTVVELIILSLILLGILNTIGMSIFERTAEIGTVAALGETRSTIITQFVLEGLILGIIGSLAGALLGYVIILIVNAAKITVQIPGASSLVTIRIKLYLSAFREAVVLSVFAAGIAALIPAVRASRMNIADALRRSL